MKKFTILSFAVMLFAFTTSAQEIRFGAKLGANLANVGDVPEGASTSMLIGAHIGAIVDIPINSNFSIQPGLLYSMKGWNESADLSIPGFFTLKYDVDQKLNYIEIPINAVYSFDEGYGFNIFAGPYVGILLSANSKGESTVDILGVPATVDVDEDIKEGLESLDIGFNIGLGYRLENGLGFSAQYGIGLTSLVAEQTETDPISGASYTIDAYGKNSVIGISVSYLFGSN
jgi:hypothetical protein